MTLDRVAERHETTPGKVATAWLLAQPTITAPIASATAVEQLHDLLAATALTIGPESVRELTAARESVRPQFDQFPLGQ